jgi:dipeptidyl aminopeptidase/acylaminoacyl peptidase
MNTNRSLASVAGPIAASIERAAKEILILILFTFLVLSPAASPVNAQDDEPVQTEITTPTGSRGVMMRPRDPGRYPAVLHLYGSGESVEKSLPVLRVFARAGYVALVVAYRDTPGAGVDLEDVAAALEYLRRSPFVGKNLVALNGFSLGARTALRLAAHQDVRAVSAIAARTSAGSPPTIIDEAALIKAPVLLQHGTEDPMVPYQDSVLLADRLKGLKHRVQLVTYRGADHNNLPWDQVYQRVLLFFRDYVR